MSTEPKTIAGLRHVGTQLKDELRFRAAHRSLRFGRVTEGKLERWYGADVLDSFHLAASGAHAPIPIMGVPASVYRGAVVAEPRASRALREMFGHERGGFASLSDLISEATSAGKMEQPVWNKVDTTGVVGVPQSLWAVATVPAAGAFGAAPAGGTVYTRASTGALLKTDPSGGDTQHIVTLTAQATQTGTLLLYDRLFSVQTAANPGTGGISVTGEQTRYTGSAGTPEYPGGIVIIPFVSVTLPNTAHNITYVYTDQDNNTGASTGAFAGRNSAAIGQADLAAGTWCAPLAAGDTGVRQLTSITFSVSPATGQVDHTIVKPLALVPMPVANVAFILDGINSAFNLVKVQDGACLALANLAKTATGASTYVGQLQLVAG